MPAMVGVVGHHIIGDRTSHNWHAYVRDPQGVITMKETAAGGVGSIFGFQHFFVHDLEAFKAHLSAMVTEDRHR